MPSPSSNIPSTTSEKSQRFLLRNLNLYGLDHLDPVILAALADERPLLLIGAHGTAKSELLNRLAAALQLEHRHFNASLISFDDLLGYPVPNEARDGLTWLRTPGDLWSAESVFLDEISRCRPETQNKLFSVIHERRVQGLPLEHLRYRWAAMNPPVGDDGSADGQGDVYAGASPLDPALADRFAWVVTVPRFRELSVVDRAEVIARGGRAPDGDGGVPALVAVARRRLGAVTDHQRVWAAAWVEGLLAPLQAMGLDLSGRRAVALAQSAVAVHAAFQALGQRLTLDRAAYVALRSGLPQRALGQAVDETALKAAHRLAVHEAEGADPIRRAIRGEPDPVRRVALALAAGAAAGTRAEFSQLVLDAVASQDPAHRHVLALVLTSAFSHADLLSAAACEQLAELTLPVLVDPGNEAVFAAGSGPFPTARHLLHSAVYRLERGRLSRRAEIAGLLRALYKLRLEFEPDAVVANFFEWHKLFPASAGQEVA